MNTRVARLEKAVTILAERQSQLDEALQRLDSVLVVLITAQSKIADAQLEDRIETRGRELRLSECIDKLPCIGLASPPHQPSFSNRCVGSATQLGES
jgi:hypothetical protein